MSNTVSESPSSKVTRMGGASILGRIPFWKIIDEAGVLLVLIVLMAALSFDNEVFGTWFNMRLIALDAALVGIVACGQTFVILTAGIDLSLGSMVAFSGVVVAGLMTVRGLAFPEQMSPQLSPWVAIPIALAFGTLYGTLQGVIITKLRITPFIVTLGSLSILQGLALVLSNAAPVQQLPRDLRWMIQIRPEVLGVELPLPMPAIIMLLVYITAWLVLRYTKLGRYAYAIGGNETATRLSGIKVDRYLIAIYSLSAFLAAMAGVILAVRLDSGNYTNGETYTLDGVAAAVIGGTSLMGGVGGVWGTLVGAVLMSVVRNALVLYNVPSMWHRVVVGGIIVGAVAIDALRKRFRS
ncbi:MAG TPA: ABC transporter permease [Aggregatilinea sp.]|uniref:ABC transporter permease n=1 Tax=Aggregatilinea sp. TaxID=2806333 RepID=UPI002C8EFFEE|nr:ABC transporter permease [Aggregatilinea sp.]HML23467.1 ABC transporter permease [Aggregatilinea sp.]